jgi:IS5 family transposase
MQTPDFFRSRIDAMINLGDPLAVLARRLPWGLIETAVALKLARRDRAGQVLDGADLFGPTAVVVGGGVSTGGRPKLPIRLMASLAYLKNGFNLSDEEVCSRWSENVLWQYFSGLEYYEHRLPCDPTQIGRFRLLLGEDGLEQLLKATIDTAVAIKAVQAVDLERVIVDTTVQEKAISHPVDSRLLEIARHKVVSAAKRAGINLRQTFAKEGKELRRKAGGYAHAKQFRRLKRTVKRQRTVLGVVMREVQRKCQQPALVPVSALALTQLQTWMGRAERIRTQKTKDKNKLYALHAPEVECLAKGKARKPYEFGVKACVVISHKTGLMMGARTFPGNPYDGHILSAAIEQATNLMQDVPAKIKQIVVDLGFRGVDADNPGMEIIHRGRIKTLGVEQKKWLRRRQAVEPAIGHLKSDHRMDRCWLKGALGDALHAISCAAGFNLRWLMRAIVVQTVAASRIHVRPARHVRV